MGTSFQTKCEWKPHARVFGVNLNLAFHSVGPVDSSESPAARLRSQATACPLGRVLPPIPAVALWELLLASLSLSPSPVRDGSVAGAGHHSRCVSLPLAFLLFTGRSHLLRLAAAAAPWPGREPPGRPLVPSQR